MCLPGGSDGTGASGRGRALTRVGLVGGWLGWVRGLSEKIAAEMGGNKDSGHDGHFLPPVSGEDDYERRTWPHARGMT